jgi:cobalt-precorrin-5B (C1)-methyltransferase
MARSGYTLPVFAVAAAKAAIVHLFDDQANVSGVTLDLLSADGLPTNGLPTDGLPAEASPNQATIPIQQVARLDAQTALAITLSDPGDNLDLTRDMPIWAKVTMGPRQDSALKLVGGEGIGKNAAGEAAIYRYARQLFDANLLSLIPATQTLTVTIILPVGRKLAERTSNQAFGILNGLSLLGTSGIAKPWSAAAHLEELQQVLADKASRSTDLVFCIGSNGLQVADRFGIAADRVVQTGNWVGAMLVQAGLLNVRSVLLLGYQGKLIKLAGGIFNTSSHLADAKLEIIAAAIIQKTGDLALGRSVLQAKTADAAYQILVQANQAELIFTDLAQRITDKAQIYVQKYADVTLNVETVLFDRQGAIIASTNGMMQS